MKKFSDPGQNTISRIRDPGQNIPDPQYCPLISPPPHSTVGGAGDGGGGLKGVHSLVALQSSLKGPFHEIFDPRFFH
jgi:hypothetical protein